jgi:hypothetical protein
MSMVTESVFSDMVSVLFSLSFLLEELPQDEMIRTANKQLIRRIDLRMVVKF